MLCALSLVRQALDPDIDLVILASQDSDLKPALAEAVTLGTAKVETFSWYNPARRHKSTQINCESNRLWNPDSVKQSSCAAVTGETIGKPTGSR